MSISLCEKQDLSRIRNGCLDTKGLSSRRLSISMTIDIILLFLFAQERSSARFASRQEKSVFLWDTSTPPEWRDQNAVQGKAKMHAGTRLNEEITSNGLKRTIRKVRASTVFRKPSYPCSLPARINSRIKQEKTRPEGPRSSETSSRGSTDHLRTQEDPPRSTYGKSASSQDTETHVSEAEEADCSKNFAASLITRWAKSQPV